MLATVALAAVGGAAHAEQGGAQMILAANDFVAPTYSAAGAAPRRTLEWDAAKGRWGLSLGMESHAVDSSTQWIDVSPGVYYRLTKRLHIGGAVNLAPDPALSSHIGQPQAPAPRVRLETTFKF